MTKLSTRQPEAQKLRVLSGGLRVLGKANEYLYNVELDLLDDRTTKNGWRYENLEGHRAKFSGIPLLIAYTHGGTRIGDGHNYRLKRTKDGREYASFTDATSERIIGTLSDDEADIRIEVRDGHKWIVGKGTIWAWYAAEAVEKIAVRGRMDISIETLVTQRRIEEGEEVEEAYIPLGATILGDEVDPAVIGAGIRPLCEIDTRELKIRAASFIKKTIREEEKGVKKTMNNAKRLRELEALFPNERVLCVSDDGLTVGLYNLQNGDVRTYGFTAEEPNAVLESRYQDANAKITLVTANGTEMSADLGELIGSLQNRVSELSADVEREKGLRETAESTVRTMQAAEKKSRRETAKSVIRKEMAEINKIQKAKEEPTVEESLCKQIESAIDGGEYDDVMDENGEWCGAERACASLKAKCMDAITENSRKALEKKRVITAWDALTDGGSESADPFSQLKY